MGNETQIIYINSFNRSGSTILGCLLGRIPGIVFLGEVHNLALYANEHRPCFCGEKINQCYFWSSVIRGLNINRAFQTKLNYKGVMRRLLRRGRCLESENWSSRLLNTLMYRYAADDDRVLRNIENVYRAFEQKNGATVFCDSSKRTSLAKLLHHRNKYPVKIVQLVRDGRAVVNSVMNRKQIPARQTTKSWLRFHQNQRRLLSDFDSEDVVFLRYEDLCQFPEESLAKICRLVGVEWSGAMNVNPASDLHFIGGSPTVRNNKHSVEKLRLDEKWRHELSSAHLEAFDLVAGEMNRSLGYE